MSGMIATDYTDLHARINIWASHFPMISPEVNNQFNLWRD